MNNTERTTAKYQINALLADRTADRITQIEYIKYRAEIAHNHNMKVQDVANLIDIE